MTAPIWMAAPPEVHSALLSGGPGPGPLLAAAESWNSLSTVYAETAAELAALLASVQGGTWDGPTAATYAAAHAPYLAWLTDASVNSAATAARQETAATAYTIALAAMPTLPELAANHATNAVLVATNFFGINAIPIAVNEADYVRMWIQAATVMTSYQAVATAAVAASPQTPTAPQIEKANPASIVSDVGNRIYDSIYNWLESLPLPPDTENDVLQWLEQIGYLNLWNKYLEPLSNAFFNSPYFQSMFAGFDPFLPLLGNPLIFFTPFNIAFALGYPLDIGSYIAFLSETFSFIALDLTAAVATGNPATIGFTILFTTVEAVGTIITDTIALLKTLLEQFLVLLIPVIAPLLTLQLASLAAGTALSPAAGLSGLAALAAIPPPAAPPILPPVAALVPSIPTPTSAPVPAPAEVAAPSATTGSPPPPATAPPTTNGAGVGMNMGMGMGAGMENYGYLVGDLSAVTKRVGGFGARKTAPVPDGAEAAAVAATPREPTQRQRSRRPKTQMLGRGYEYMDLEDDDASSGVSVAAVAASVTGAGTQGFAGAAAKAGTGQAAGLATLADDALGGGPRMPMMPGTWGADSAPPPDLPEGPANS